MNGAARTRRLMAVSALACAMVAAVAFPAAGQQNRTVTSGDLETPAGVHIGKGRMTREHDRDRTVAQVKVIGLSPRTQYTAQVHTGPCSATPAGGAVYAGFSPSPFRVTTDRNGDGEGSTHLDAVAGPTAATIVVYSGATVVGCADLTP